MIYQHGKYANRHLVGYFLFSGSFLLFGYLRLFYYRQLPGYGLDFEEIYIAME